MRAYKFRYPIVILTIIIVLIVAAGVVALFYSTRSTPSTETMITTPNTPMVSTRQVASGFTQPTGIVSTPGDDHLYIVEQGGTIRRVTPNQTNSQVFMDITDRVAADGEMGLLGLSFHPNFDQNGYIFVNYIDKNKNTVIARYHVADDTVDTTGEKVILRQDQPYTNHNGGDLAFGQDGFLYVSLGDGGSAGDPDNNAQNLNSLLGKILRININTDEAYSIPTDNPFAGREDARAEIWAYGLRNPWRISFDSQTHDLYIADVGQSELEEVNFQPADSKGGQNYGWRCYEGTNEYNLDGCSGVNSYVPPIVEYNHEDGHCSITGGYVYRGEAQPALQGKYFYGDFCGSQLYYAEQENSSWKQTLALETTFAISTFGEGSDGELYLADYDSGNIYKIEATSAS